MRTYFSHFTWSRSLRTSFEEYAILSMTTSKLLPSSAAAMPASSSLSNTSLSTLLPKLSGVLPLVAIVIS